MYFPAPPREPGANGRPSRHGGRAQARRSRVLARPGGDHHHPDHPVRHRLAAAWAGCTSSWPAAPDGRTTTASCRSSRAPSSGCTSITCPATAARNRCGCGHHTPGPAAGEVNRAWQAFLRRFDIEHTFRFFKQVLGWTRPKLRNPAAADRWTWLILACYAQLRLARTLAADIRLPWQQPCPPGRLTPARVRRGFRNIRQTPALPGQRAETRQTRTRPPARIKEPPPGHPPRRGQDRQTRPTQEENPQAEGLNNKLRACLRTHAAADWCGGWLRARRRVMTMIMAQ